MRLIDADEIIKWADDSVSQYGGTYTTDMLNMFGLFKHIIDNAPTVEPDTMRLALIDDIRKKQNSADKAFLEGYKKGKHDRPQAEWIPNYTSQFMNPGRQCSLCGKIVEFSENFCPQCGSKMEVKEDD